MGILLPAPIHEGEEFSFGVRAPTSSTTVALSLGDALAITVARNLHTLAGRGPAEVFQSFHPGGTIGATHNSMPAFSPAISATSSNSSGSSIPLDYLSSHPILPLQQQQQRPVGSISNSQPTDPSIIRDGEHNRLLITNNSAFVPIMHIPTISSTSSELRVIDILLAAIQHPDAKSWVFLSDSDKIIPPRKLRFLSQHTRDADGSAYMHALTSGSELADRLSSFSVHREKWLCVSSSSTVDEVRHLLLATGTGQEPGELDYQQRAVVVAVIQDDAKYGGGELTPSSGTCLGVIEAENLLDERG